MITPRNILIILSIITLIASTVPLFEKMDVSVSGFSVAEKMQESGIPQTATPYLVIIMLASIVGIAFGCKKREVIIH